MVKLLNTPFGNYGYVLNRDASDEPLAVLSASIKNGPGRDIPRIRPSAYDARFLRTTDLSKGSKIMTVSDPYSYVKHGLLHNGQELRVPLEVPIHPLQSISQNSRGVSSAEKSKSNSRFSRDQQKLLPKNAVFATWQERSKGLPQHAGRATVIRHHKGFAYDYAACRSGFGPLACSLGSADFIGETEERPDSVDGKEGSEDEKQDEKPSSKQTFIRIDPNGRSLSKLNKLKSRRLQEVYAEMYEKMDKHRRDIILDRVKALEKIKDTLHHDEIEERKNLLKTSADTQRKQLRQLRNRHDKDFNSRLNSVYKSKSSKQLKDSSLNPDPRNLNPLLNSSALRISLPREVYGLPENTEPRPETVPSKLPYRFKPGKLLLDSYHQTRNVLPTKFNNVWTQASPTSTPRKQALESQA